MKVELMNQVLRKYSPMGLCAETLCEQNGAPSKTLACATGCFALEVIDKTTDVQEALAVDTLDGRYLLEHLPKDVRKDADKALIEILVEHYRGKGREQVVSAIMEQSSPGEVPGLMKAFKKYFGLSLQQVDDIVSYNDTCIARDSDTDKIILNKAVDEAHRSLPAALRRTIFSLRKKYEEYING